MSGRIAAAAWAFLLGLIWPGIALIYARRWRAGVLVCVLSCLITAAAAFVTRTELPTPQMCASLFIVMSAALVVQLFLASYSAWRVGTGVRDRTQQPAWYQTAWFVFIVVIGIQTSTQRILPLGWRSFSIPSPSNVPTLLVGDEVIAFTQRPYTPARGDMVVFKHGGGLWAKRVIGLPGETVRITAGIVSINAQPIARTDQTPYDVPDENGSSSPAIRYTEHLPGRAAHPIVSQGITADAQESENTRDYIVPLNAYFVLGDNRDNSVDSRFANIGFIASDALVGRMMTIFWSKDHARIGRGVD